jgi:hypothetical protein
MKPYKVLVQKYYRIEREFDLEAENFEDAENAGLAAFPTNWDKADMELVETCVDVDEVE